MSRDHKSTDRMTLKTCTDCKVKKVRAAFQHIRTVGSRRIVVEKSYCNRCDRDRLVERLQKKGMVVR